MKVKCVRNLESDGIHPFTLGKIYEAKECLSQSNMYMLSSDRGTYGGWYKSRFKVVEEMKFEVGKKYRGKASGHIRTCLYVTPTNRGVLSDEKDEILIFNNGLWEEYREPVKRWFNKYKKKDGSVYLGRIDGHASEREAKNRVDPGLDEYLDTIEIEF